MSKAIRKGNGLPVDVYKVRRTATGYNFKKLIVLEIYTVHEARHDNPWSLDTCQNSQGDRFYLKPLYKDYHTL